MLDWKSSLRRTWDNFSHTPFGHLLRLFVGRMFHGGGEAGTAELGLGIGAMLILLAMPGLLVSLLMFEKYGSLVRFLRGDGAYDPFSATIPDEYFFIALSTVVTGAAALWCWDSVFLDRRDHANLVPLPVSLGTIFFANFSAILVVAALFTFVVNAASLVLFPVAVVGSQGSLATFVRFTAGHTAAVLFASVFSFFAVFALAGLLMAFLPAAAFRRVSLLARFAVAVVLLALLSSVFTVPDLLRSSSVAAAHRVAVLPPVSFLGVARSIWHARDSFVATMTRASLSAFAAVFGTTVVAYAVSFRRCFLRTPEIADVAPLPRTRLAFSPLALLHKVILGDPTQRACYHFIARTLLRSDAHLQILSAFAALNLVCVAATITAIRDDRFFLARHSPSADFLSIPFLVSFCTILGVRFAFEIPSNLTANWIFRMWLPPGDREARGVARRVLLAFSLPWIAPATFAVTLKLFGAASAALHTATVTAFNVLLVEILLLQFRKIPFTCPYPPFQSNSGVILVAYLFGFLVFTDYIPQIEHWALVDPLRILTFVPLLAIAFLSLRAYRGQMLDMDKQLVFDEASPSPY